MHRLVRATLGTLSCILCSGAAASDDQSPLELGSKSSEILITKIVVSDLRRSYDFYTKVVGLRMVQLPPGVQHPEFDDPEVASTEVGLNFSGSPADPYLCLVKTKGKSPTPDQAQWVTIVMKTPDTRLAVQRVAAAGFSVEFGPTKMLGMLVGEVRDPDGYAIEFIQARSVQHR